MVSDSDFADLIRLGPGQSKYMPSRSAGVVLQ